MRNSRFKKKVAFITRLGYRPKVPNKLTPNSIGIVLMIFANFTALQKKASDRNLESCDMWSFAILLWELSTREIPFAEFSPMEIGLKVNIKTCRITCKGIRIRLNLTTFFFFFASGGHRRITRSYTE